MVKKIVVRARRRGTSGETGPVAGAGPESAAVSEVGARVTGGSPAGTCDRRRAGGGKSEERGRGRPAPPARGGAGSRVEGGDPINAGKIACREPVAIGTP